MSGADEAGAHGEPLLGGGHPLVGVRELGPADAFDHPHGKDDRGDEHGHRCDATADRSMTATESSPLAAAHHHTSNATRRGRRAPRVVQVHRRRNSPRRDRLVGDEVVEPAPPRAAYVDRAGSGRGSPVRRCTGPTRVAARGVRGGAAQSPWNAVAAGRTRAQFVLLVGWQHAEPPAGGEIDHGRPEAGGGQRGIVRQHVDDRRAARSRSAPRFSAARGRGGATRCSTTARTTNPATTMSEREHEEQGDGARGEHHQG